MATQINHFEKERLQVTGSHIESTINLCQTNCASLPACRLVAKKEHITITPGSATCQKVADSEDQSTLARQ